mgnify:CR=1 FL=1
MSGRAADWSDLLPRLASAAVMLGVFAAALWLGGWVFSGLVAAVAAAMIWEALTMFGAPAALSAAILSGVVVFAALYLPGAVAPAMLLAAALVAAARVPQERAVFLALALVILIGAGAFGALRGQGGALWVLWLVAVVVASDVLGYFAGRRFGGPKFWPRVSPKKTWSGTIAGWAGAALVGAAFAGPLQAGPALVPLSVLTAVAGQLGDIGESAVKRRRGVKDSSRLIPGHGGVLDRFDALVAAAIVTAVLQTLGMMPGVT